MAGVPGNRAYLVAAKQTGKGVEPTAWQDKYFFEGGNISPSRGTDQLSETDDNRNAGDFYVTQTAVEGSPEVYVRDSSIHRFLEYGLGAAVHSGTEPNFEHKISAAASLPYITFGKGQGNLLFEQFNDCKVDELTISAGTASPLVCSASVMGRSAKRLTSEWASGLAPPAAATGAPLNYNQALVKLAGVETRLVSSFECTISNNLSLQQTDDSVPLDVVEGTLAVTLGFDLIFETLAEYNKFHYGGEAGTTQSSSIFTTAASFEFNAGANNFLLFEFPKLAYTEFPVEPDPGGGPVTVSVRAAAQRHSEGFVKATVKNQVEK